MQTFLRENKRQFFFMLRFFLIAFGVLASIPVFLTDSDKYVAATYAIVFTLSLSLCLTLLIGVLGYVEYVREERFFTSYPYHIIKKRAEKIEFVFNSIWNFSKRHYKFEIDDEKYVAIYYNDVIKTVYGNSLVILKEKPGSKELFAHQIDYKSRTLQESDLVTELKNLS